MRFISVLFLLSVFYNPQQIQAKMLQPDVQDIHYSVNRTLLHPTDIQRRLLEQFHQWEGTPYEWGGTKHDGIDCSALTQKIFSATMKMKLPRTTADQIKLGRLIFISQLQPGDLVFFQPKKSVRHVGIYMGNNKFMHASSSKGVTLSSLQNPYWVNHFETARRVTG